MLSGVQKKTLSVVFDAPDEDYWKNVQNYCPQNLYAIFIQAIQCRIDK